MRLKDLLYDLIGQPTRGAANGHMISRAGPVLDRWGFHSCLVCANYHALRFREAFGQ